MNKKLFYLIAPFMVFLISSCKLSEPIEVGEIENFSIQKASLKTINIEFDLPVKNPNGVPFTIQELKCNIFLNESLLGEINNEEVLRIPARSEQKHTIKAEIKLKGILSIASGILGAMSSSQKTIKLQGYVQGKCFGVKRSVLIEEVVSLKK